MLPLETTTWIGAHMTTGLWTTSFLAQTTVSASWIDQVVLIVMVGLAVFAVCRSTRRQ